MQLTSFVPHAKGESEVWKFHAHNRLMMSIAQDVCNGSQLCRPDNSRVLTVKLGCETSLVSYSTDKHSKIVNIFYFYFIFNQVYVVSAL